MALIDVYQPCPTYNNLHTKEYYAEQVDMGGGQMVARTYTLESDGYDGRVKNPNDMEEIHAKQRQAFERAHRVEDRVALGVYYQVELPTFQDTLKQNIPALREHSPLKLPTEAPDGTPTTDLSTGFADFLI